MKKTGQPKIILGFCPVLAPFWCFAEQRLSFPPLFNFFLPILALPHFLISLIGPGAVLDLLNLLEQDRIADDTLSFSVLLVEMVLGLAYVEFVGLVIGPYFMFFFKLQHL